MSNQEEENLKFIIPYYDDFIENIYTSSKGFKCELCQKIFHIEKEFKTHMKIHNGEKPFICNFPNCFRKFNRKVNLELHEKLYHQKKNKKSIKNIFKNIVNNNNDNSTIIGIPIDDNNVNKKKGKYKLNVYSINPFYCTLIKVFENNNNKKDENENNKNDNENKNNNMNNKDNNNDENNKKNSNDNNNKSYLCSILQSPIPKMK